MKLAATVAANNKKRKNALQIQKYIGEETPDAISGKDLKRISALGGKQTRYGDGPEGTAKRKAELEKKRGMKLDDHPQFKEETISERRQRSDRNRRSKQEPVVNPKISKSLTNTGAIGIGIPTPDEKIAKSQQAQKDANKSEETLKRQRQMRNLMRGSSIGRNKPKPKK